MIWLSCFKAVAAFNIKLDPSIGILSEKEIQEVAQAQAQYKIINNQPDEKLAVGGGLRGLRGLQTLRKSSLNSDVSDI